MLLIWLIYSAGVSTTSQLNCFLFGTFLPHETRSADLSVKLRGFKIWTQFVCLFFFPHITSLAATDRGRKISKQIICSSKTDFQKLNEGMEIRRGLIYFQSTVTPIQESSLRIRNMVIKLRNRVALNRANIQRKPLPLSLDAIYT